MPATRLDVFGKVFGSLGHFVFIEKAEFDAEDIRGLRAADGLAALAAGQELCTPSGAVVFV